MLLLTLNFPQGHLCFLPFFTRKNRQIMKVDNAKMRQVAQLLRLPGIGPVSSWAFVMEFFGWRRFRNRREVAALAGLTPTPFDSGGKLREQGISKAATDAFGPWPSRLPGPGCGINLKAS